MHHFPALPNFNLALGPDATPVVTPIRQAGVENHRTLSHLPHSIPLQSAPLARIIVGWWDREVHIWRLRRPLKDLLDGDDVEQSINDNRKLLGRILIKGESNITSTSISRDGTLLVVSTVSAIKAFRLSTSSTSPEELKIRKIEIPASIENSGSTLVRVSPNGQWLSWIQDGTKVMVASIKHTTSSDDSQVYVNPRPAKLTRLKRDIPKHVRLGGLGNYDRRVTHVAFSPDSSILATADLAGYVDTWVMQDGNLQNGANSSKDDDASPPASDDSSDSESEDEKNVEAGPRWVRNPKAPLFPKLSHAPVVLSFSDAALGSSLRGKGSEADGYILLAVTATSRIYTFHPLEGSLTRWSRRNGVWKLPEEIRGTRDLIKGAVWQGSRVWMYGASYLFMLDLALDFTEEADAGARDKKRSRKRKRGLDTGAGSRTESGQALAPTHVRVSLAEDGKKGEWVDVEMADADVDDSQRANSKDEDDEDDDEETSGGDLQKLRDRESSHKEGEDTTAEDGRDAKPRNWWHTYKYRPILGVLPLATDDHDSAAETNGAGSKNASTVLPALEVALVERPKWDVDMPARYVED